MDNKILEKLKSNNLPTLVGDGTLNYYICNNDGMKIYQNLEEALNETFNLKNLYYPFTYRTIITDSLGKKRYKLQKDLVHDFDSVIENLYKNPESFYIPKSYEEFYSEQELNYLNSVKKYLEFLKLKDEVNTPKNINRYKNEVQKKYSKCPVLTYNNKQINNIISGILNCEIRKYKSLGWLDIEGNKIPFNYDDIIGKIVLINDEDENIRLSIKYTSYEIVKYKDIKKKYKNKDFKDTDKLVILYYKVYEIFS